MDHRERYQARRDLGQLSPVLAAEGARQAVAVAEGEVKAQGVRLADIFVFGPLMLYAGLGQETPKWLKLGMVIIGGGTIIYNLVNFMDIARRNGLPATMAGFAGMATGPIDRARAEALKRQMDMVTSRETR